MSVPSGNPIQPLDEFSAYAPKEKREQPATALTPVENDFDEYVPRHASSREGTDKRLPRAVPLPPVTGLPPVAENACAEKIPRARETFIDGLRVPPSLVAERLRPSPPMQRHRNKLIAPLLVTACAVAVLVAYYFSVGSLIPESGRGPKLASLDSRIVVPSITAVAPQKFRMNEAQDSTAAAPPDNEISSQGAIIPPVKTSPDRGIVSGHSTVSEPSSAEREGISGGDLFPKWNIARGRDNGDVVA
jgi:hypothetical protein